jgi:hypothetical protein
MSIHSIFDQIQSDFPRIPPVPFFVAGHLYKTDGRIMVRVPADNGEFVADAPPVLHYPWDRDQYADDGFELPDPGNLILEPCDCINVMFNMYGDAGELGKPMEGCEDCEGTGMLGRVWHPVAISDNRWLSWGFVNLLRKFKVTHVYPAKRDGKTGPSYYFTGPGFEGIVMGHKGPSSINKRRRSGKTITPPP